jgi:hypothetical protein
MVQKQTIEIPKSETFFSATLILFLFRIIPDSRHINPACIMKTSIAQISIHRRSMFAALLSVVISAALAVCSIFSKIRNPKEKIISLLKDVLKATIFSPYQIIYLKI